MDVDGCEAWPEELGECVFLQLSLQPDLQGLDLGAHARGIQFGFIGSLVSQVLIVSCFAVIFFLGFRARRAGLRPDWSQSSKQSEGLPMHVLVLLGLTMGLDFFCTDQYQPSMLAISSDFAVSHEAIASTIQIHQLSYAVAMLGAGRWLHLLGLRQMILMCQLFFAASTLGCAFAPSFGWFVAGRVLQGIAASCSVGVSAMLSAWYSDRNDMRRAANIISCIALVGHIAGPASGGLLAGIAGWRAAFLAVFGLVIFMLLANYLLLPESSALNSHQETQDVASKPQSNGTMVQQTFVLLGLSLLRGSSYEPGKQRDVLRAAQTHVSVMYLNYPVGTCMDMRSGTAGRELFHLRGLLRLEHLGCS